MKDRKCAVCNSTDIYYLFEKMPDSPLVWCEACAIKLMVKALSHCNCELEAYTMTNKQEITDFVASHSYLSEVLRDAPDQIRRYFGNAELVLQVNMDSGYEDSGELNLFIRTELNVDDAFAQLDQLRLSWLRGYPQLIQRTFFVTVQRIRNEI